MPVSIFYSWQSDLPNNVNRGFVEDALERAIKNVNRDLRIDEVEREDALKIDKDTQGLPGSPPIVEAIFEKISKAVAFVPDVTFVGKSDEGRPLPNPNVLIEYGWALKVLGHSRVISVMNTAYGEPSAETLPFDMRHLRWPTRYHLPTSATTEDRKRVKESLVKDLTAQLQAMQKAGLLTPPPAETGAKKSYAERLRDWHDASHARYIGFYVHSPVRLWPVSARANHYQLSYLLCRPEKSTTISHKDFIRALEQAHEQVRRRVSSGWSMFYVFTKEDIRPYIVPDHVEGEEVEVIETNLMKFDGVGLPDFWRITKTGYAALLRVFREDEKAVVRSSTETLQPGGWFSPRLLVQDLAELTAHAAAMAEVLGDCTAVEFRCSWYGLTNRVISDFSAGVHWDRRVSRADSRTSTTRASVEVLQSNWPSVVSNLANPVTMLFDGLETGEEWVRYIAPTFPRI